jgi:hypothetical protein
MHTKYQARWISKNRLQDIKRHRNLHDAMLMDCYNGVIVVEPVGSNFGDGPVFSHSEADYELQPVWYLGPLNKLKEARRRLGLEQQELAAA